MRTPLTIAFLAVLTACDSTERRGSAVVADSGRGPLDATAFLCEFAEKRYTPEARAHARLRIGAALRRAGLKPEFQPYERESVRRRRYSGVNVYAELPATVASDEWVVVGAHYDTVPKSPGADDDGSGVTAVLLAAESLSAMKERRKNVLFAFFDQEELGLVGSTVFVSRLKAEGRKVVAAHCIDMIGWDGDKDRAVEIGHWTMGRNGDGFMKLYREAAAGLPGVGTVTRTNMGRSDHVPFIQAGIPAVLVTQEYEGGDWTPHYHRPTDTCDVVDMGYLLATAALVARAVELQIR